MTKEIIKQIIASTKPTHYTYINHASNTCKRKTSKNIKILSSQNIETYSRSKLVTLAKTRANHKGSTICHIIGSGWSLNNSFTKIQQQDFIVGFNFSALLKLKYDLYFIEFGGEKVSDIAEKHISLVKENVTPHTDLIFFKNIWERKNDLPYIVKNWTPHAKIVKDFMSTCLSPRMLDQTLNYCLNDRSDFLPQYCSTAITSIFLAYFCGFKKIVIHGVDFGGNYFFEEPSFKESLKYAPNKNGKSNFYLPTNSPNDTHITAASDVGMKNTLPILNKILDKKGVTLYSASSNSPLSKILPIYNN